MTGWTRVTIYIALGRAIKMKMLEIKIPKALNVEITTQELSSGIYTMISTVSD